MSTPIVGFYGKLPSHGDFLRRRVPDEFVNAWDPWLQDCLRETQAVLGDGWLDVYLTSPLWHFACAPGVLGPQPLLGVTVPSVDRVGRYFNLTLVAALPPETNALMASLSSEPFFSEADRLMLETLATQRIDLVAFDQDVQVLGDSLEHTVSTGSQDVGLSGVLRDGAAPWQVAIGGSRAFGSTLQAMAALRLAALYEPLVVMWTEGSRYVEPSLLVQRGLPAPATFPAMLTGGWSAHGWSSPDTWTTPPALSPSYAAALSCASGGRTTAQPSSKFEPSRSSRPDDETPPPAGEALAPDGVNGVTAP